jgi:hypothetical protein
LSTFIYSGWAYEVFEHIHILWMGIWVHPYSVTPVQLGGVIFWKNGVKRLNQNEPK